MQFLDVRTDFAFKKVFGSIESKEILISFLDAIIVFPDDQKIKDITIVDPYSIPMIKGMKDTFVDVKAVLENGKTVIVEMQVLNHDGFEKRILYNAAKNYSAQLKKGEKYHLLNPVIEQWLYFLKHAGELSYIPDDIDIEIQKALNIANKACMSKEELEVQHKRKDFIYIQKASISLAERTGMKKGMKTGMKRGIEQEKLHIAKNLLDILDDETIALKTGLSVETIASLR